ncbi:dynein axonemal intermediate chain 4-like [Neodiprion fabricii]|uniref:dynein axonemal intermediate chain 4-like n=1 Tax=Neodiprion fabricii TaxID=2872261 RepID=UPI001ED94EE6|nr:dynein axonemal intermediate chain 4-like [Neodiprion fabricii]
MLAIPIVVDDDRYHPSLQPYIISKFHRTKRTMPNKMRSRSISLRKLVSSDGGGNKNQSITSAKTSMPPKNRRLAQKTLTSILNRRRNFRVIHDDVDLTPKNLTHAVYHEIEENHLTAFDTIGLGQGSSNTQLFSQSSGSQYGNLKATSSLMIKSSSIHMQQTQLMDDFTIDGSLMSGTLLSITDEDRAPSQFYLPRYDLGLIRVHPEKVNIILQETDIFFLFELPQLTVNVSSEEGLAVKQMNEQYEYITVGPGSNRKLANAEAQTPCVYRKNRSTYLARTKRRNQGNMVNNWIMYDTFEKLKTSKSQGPIFVQLEEARQKALEKKISPTKLPQIEESSEQWTLEMQLAQLAEQTDFLDSATIVERMVASSLYIVAQKRFKGIIKQDPYSPRLQFTYSLDFLWSFVSEHSAGYNVACFCWNYVNKDVLAVGYGPIENQENRQGLVMIWTAKNPHRAGRWHYFNSPVSALDWSRNRPNLLAIGFYDGVVQVIDVSNKNLVIMRCSSRTSSPSYAPHWQVQWWPGEDEVMFEEQLYTCNQDGRILSYRADTDFSCNQIMRISRNERKIKGVEQQPEQCVVHDISITRNPGALVLCKHPGLPMIYFVGSDEGCIHRCSTTYLQQHIDSFRAHNGPIYAIEFSPFCSKIFLTCGADWCTRIWADGINEPLITLSTQMACVQKAAWSPKISTVVATIVNNQIDVWDIRRKSYTAASSTTCDTQGRLLLLEFTANGNQLVAGDSLGTIFIYNLEGMPFPPYNQTGVLVTFILKALETKPNLIRKLKKLGKPF